MMRLRRPRMWSLTKERREARKLTAHAAWITITAFSARLAWSSIESPRFPSVSLTGRQLSFVSWVRGGSWRARRDLETRA